MLRITQDKDFEVETEMEITFEWMQNFQRSIEVILKEQSLGFCVSKYKHILTVPLAQSTNWATFLSNWSTVDLGNIISKRI